MRPYSQNTQYIIGSYAAHHDISEID